ncbi:hypothetical protein HYW74_00300 [Candidatus Pacearchaeota archaeon]|nr:hypothetical protein [Candidatus Pacearchaeota archaeon]
MKRGILSAVILFILLFGISFTSALEIKTPKNDYSKGENFLATLQGNILDEIPKENVGFYKGNAPNVPIALTYDFTKINNTYYIYAILPFTEQNITLRIKDVYFREQNQFQTQTLEKTFNVKNTTATFNVKPGFITTSNDFPVTLTNNIDSDINVVYTLANISNSVFVPSQNNKEIIISISNIIFTQLTSLKFSSGSLTYDFPAYIVKNETIPEEENITEINRTTNRSTIREDNLRFSLQSIDLQLNKGQAYFYPVDIINIGDRKAENITISVSDSIKSYVKIKPASISNLDIDESRRIDINFSFSKKGDYSGYIQATSLNSSDRILLNFKIGENLTTNFTYNRSSGIIQNTTQKSCAELNGVRCVSGEVCQGSLSLQSSGCCIGICKPFGQEPQKKRNWTILIIILLALAVVGAFIWLKMKKPGLSAKDILKKKEDDFEERFETKGKLSKV